MTRQFCREKQGKNGHIFAKIRQCAQVAKWSDFYVFFPSKRRKRFVLLSWLSSQADNSPDKRPTKFSKRCCLLHTRRSGACCLRNVKSQTGISWSTSRFTATLLYMLPLCEMWIKVFLKMRFEAKTILRVLPCPISFLPSHLTCHSM